VTENFVVNYALWLPSVAIVRRDRADRRYYVHLPDGLLLHSVEADGSRRFFHFDETGSTVFLSNDAGEVTDTYGVTPFGETVSRSGRSENPFVFLGAYGVMDDGGGLHYMRFRYLDSRTARFLSMDPVTSVDPRGINPYQYARGNPLRSVDPLGLEDKDFDNPVQTPQDVDSEDDPAKRTWLRPFELRTLTAAPGFPGKEEAMLKNAPDMRFPLGFFASPNTPPRADVPIALTEAQRLQISRFGIGTTKGRSILPFPLLGPVSLRAKEQQLSPLPPPVPGRLVVVSGTGQPSVDNGPIVVNPEPEQHSACGCSSDSPHGGSGIAVLSAEACPKCHPAKDVDPDMGKHSPGPLEPCLRRRTVFDRVLRREMFRHLSFEVLYSAPL
jgi:RHS repeat-associated protein